jgi:hypothetical protein
MPFIANTAETAFEFACIKRLEQAQSFLGRNRGGILYLSQQNLISFVSKS